MASSEKISSVLFSWWQLHRRTLPWRKKIGSLRDPYHVVLSEIMLQQTQVERVLPKYEAWLHCWPTLLDLASAPLNNVLIQWQGLGYNRRARYLWLLAREITAKYYGHWPTTEQELRKLPGIGRYTARAMMVFAFGQQAGVVDTNIRRIFERVFKKKFVNEKETIAFADEIFPPNQADSWHQALMDFGALICKAQAPRCEICPLSQYCHANLLAQQKGFTTFAEQLAFLRTRRIPKKKGKDAGLRFEQTDRFFRGRIVDVLRRGPLSLKKLREIMAGEFGLLDPVRLQDLVGALQKEGMVKLSPKEKISLP